MAYDPEYPTMACQRCGQELPMIANPGAEKSWQRWASPLPQHEAECPGHRPGDGRPISRAEERAIRDFVLGHVTPGPFMEDGGDPSSAD